MSCTRKKFVNCRYCDTTHNEREQEWQSHQQTSKNFSPSELGYNPEEVDSFLEQVSSEIDAMLQKIADLKGRLTNTEQQLAVAQDQIAHFEENSEKTAADKTNAAVAASEHQISQVLLVAQASADKLVADAKDNAERIRNEADQKAREVIRQALDEIDRLKQSREDFRAEYRKLLQHFMDDADSVFPQGVLNSGNPQDAHLGAAPASSAPAQKPSAPAANDFSDLD